MTILEVHSNNNIKPLQILRLQTILSSKPLKIKDFRNLFPIPAGHTNDCMIYLRDDPIKAVSILTCIQ